VFADASKIATAVSQNQYDYDDDNEDDDRWRSWAYLGGLRV